MVIRSYKLSDHVFVGLQPKSRLCMKCWKKLLESYRHILKIHGLKSSILFLPYRKKTMPPKCISLLSTSSFEEIVVFSAKSSERFRKSNLVSTETDADQTECHWSDFWWKRMIMNRHCLVNKIFIPVLISFWKGWARRIVGLDRYTKENRQTNNLFRNDRQLP